MTIELQSSINTYDELPYESYAYANSHPNHLRTLGTLFGMNPPPLENARILELGCASGGNLIPHACNYPNAKFVGVDLAKVQITHANDVKNALELNNIEFHNCSIMDIDKNFGKFDYIICHGVLSWVPEFVRDKIFKICKDNLTENGIAYISYNTLPGWNMVRAIRDMMLYHSKEFPAVQDKIDQSRLLLNFIKDSLEGTNSPYAETLKSEAELLSKQSDHYLRHDHLEEDNKQFYFQEFISHASKCNLQYLSDSNIASMYLNNLPQKVVDVLKDLKDVVRVEQYMDFINNRRFRMSLLCHDAIKLNRKINITDIQKFSLTFKVLPVKALSEIKINDPLETSSFYFNNNTEPSISTSSPALKAILYTFSENIGNPISFEEITKEATKKLGDAAKLGEVKTEFLNNAMKLVLQGYITLSLEKHKKINLEKPKTSKLISFQILDPKNMWVTNLNHETVTINIFEKFALRYMNGKNSKEQIFENVLNHINSGEMILTNAEQKVEDIDKYKNDLRIFLDQAISKAAINALLL